MRALLLLPLVLLFAACGTADQTRLLERDRKIVAGMEERYDLSALTGFLRRVIADHPVFEKVQLAATKTEDAWRIERVDPPARLRSGDWVIWDAKQGDEMFEFYFMFDPKFGRSVSIQAMRLARDQFQFVGISISEWVSLGAKK